MKLLIHNKNPVIHFATLDFRIPFNDSLDSKIKHLKRMMKTRKFVYKEQEYSSAELEYSATVIQISTIQIRLTRTIYVHHRQGQCAIHFSSEETTLVMTRISWGHLHFIQENCILSIVEAPCSDFILHLAADSFTAPSKAVGQHLSWCITSSPFCFTEDDTQK